MTKDPTSAAGAIDVHGPYFRDSAGRQVILRGVNLGGDSKAPATPDGRSFLPSDFADHRTVSFVGRPAPLDELDTHLARLRHWGFNCIRLVVTWEAVEHAGPGEYDMAYLDYITEVCQRAGAFSLHVIIDFHQDVWSRMSGGDGAPGWTFEAAGLDFSRFHAAGAAHVMQHNYDSAKGGLQASYPTMSWSGNYGGPANGIMWTLFFAGADFAPDAIVDGRNIQTYLQDHYLGAMRAIAQRVAHLPHVIGFDTLNEPGIGYIGKGMTDPIRRGQGTLWTPLEGLAVASGMPRTLPVASHGQDNSDARMVNPDGVSIWLPGRNDPFRQAGAWDIGADGQPVALKPDYFRRIGDRPVDHVVDYMLPFFHRVADTIRAIRPDWLLFAEFDPFDAAKGQRFPAAMPERSVNASHWYDIVALVTKSFSADRRIDPRSGAAHVGRAAIEESYVGEMSVLKALGDELNGGAPTLLGECGIQYDLNGAEAYRAWAAGAREPEIWAAQTAALDLMYNAIDRLLLSSTQWNYTVSNRNDPMIGDGWNQEDLSIWSADQAIEGDPLSGARAIEGFCRPYVRAAQGRIAFQRFDRDTGEFETGIDIDPSIKAPTEIYVPLAQYPDGFTPLLVGDARIERDGQVLRVFAQRAGALVLRVTR